MKQKQNHKLSETSNVKNDDNGINELIQLTSKLNLLKRSKSVKVGLNNMEKEQPESETSGLNEMEEEPKKSPNLNGKSSSATKISRGSIKEQKFRATRVLRRSKHRKPKKMGLKR